MRSMLTFASFSWNHSVQTHINITDIPNRFKVQTSAGKIKATVVWDSEGTFLVDFVERGHTINAEQ